MKSQRSTPGHDADAFPFQLSSPNQLTAFEALVLSESHKFKSILQALKDNIQKDKPTSKYEITAFKKNLAILRDKTLAIALPISDLEAIKKHIELVFIVINSLQHCQKKLEAQIVLPEIAMLLTAISQKLNDERNLDELKKIGVYIEELGLGILKVEEEIGQKDSSTLTAMQTIQGELDIDPEKLFNETIEILFNDNSHSITQNPRLVLFFEHEEVSRKVSRTVSERMSQEMRQWPVAAEIHKTASPELLLKYQKLMDLNLYFLKVVLANRSELKEEYLHLLGIFHLQASYYFLAAFTYFKLKNDYDAKDEKVFNFVQHYNSELETLFLNTNLFIEDRINRRNDKSKTQDEQKYYTQQILNTCHGILNNRVCYIFICAYLHKFDLAEQAYQKALDAIFEAQGIIDSLKDLEEEKRKEGQHLLFQAHKKLTDAKKIIEEYHCHKASLTDPENKVLFLYKKTQIHIADIPAIFQVFKNSTQGVLATPHNPVYDKLLHNYSADFSANPVRRAFLVHILRNYCIYYKSMLENHAESAEKSFSRITQYQENINVLFACLSTVGKIQAEKFPESSDLNLLIMELIANIQLHTQEVEAMLFCKEVQCGQYLRLYGQVNANFQLLVNYVTRYKTDALNDNENGIIKLKSLFDLYATFMAIYSQFANTQNTQTLYAQALLLFEEIEGKEVMSPGELAEIKGDIDLPHQVALAHDNLHAIFISLSEKIPEIERCLDNLEKMSLQSFWPTKQGEASFERLLATIQNDNISVIELADCLLTINKEVGINNAILLLKSCEDQFQRKMRMFLEEKQGILGVTAETIEIILDRIGKSLAILQQSAIQSEQKIAKQHEDQLLKRKKKQEKEEIKKLQQQHKKLNGQNKTQQQVEEVASSPWYDLKSKPEALKPKAKPPQRSKKEKEHPRPIDEENEWIKDLFKQEKKQTKRQRIAEKTRQKEQERQERIAASKRSKSLAKQADKEKQLSQRQLNEAKIEEEKLREIVKKQTQREQERQFNQQRDHLSHQLVEELINDLIQETAAMSLEDPDISQLVTELSRLRSEAESHHVPDRKVNVDEKFKNILSRFNEHGIRAYLYGGYPRDLLLLRKPRDGDIVVFCSKQQAQAILGQDCVENMNSDKQLVYKGEDLRCEAEDLTLSDFVNQLDFTINAFLVDSKGNVFAPIANSLADLSKSALYTIGQVNESFATDPRRMYRCISQSFCLFAKAPLHYNEALVQNACYLTKLPFAAFRKNVLNLFRQGYAKNTVVYLSDSKLLQHIMPPLKQLEFSQEELSWFEAECEKIDKAEGHPVRFDALIAMFLSPVIMCEAKMQPDLSLQAIIDKTIKEMFLPFSEPLEESLLKSMSALLHHYYGKYIVHKFEQIVLYQNQRTPSPLFIPDLSPTYIQSFAQKADLHEKPTDALSKYEQPRNGL